jgi:hypothetical protein
MKIQTVAGLTLPFAAAALLAVTTLPAFGSNAAIPSLNDGEVHSFQGCLTQEPTGVKYFDLKNAKSDNGKDMGTVRLTGDPYGMSPNGSLDQQVKVRGIYEGRLANDPGSGHIAVKDAEVVGGKCS